MLELKKQSYPSASLDEDIFETMDERYKSATRFPQISVPTVPAADRTKSLMDKMIAEQHFGQARSIYLELKSMGVVVRCHWRYAKAAIGTANAVNEEEWSAFVDWLRLLPVRNQSRRWERALVYRALFHNTVQKSLRAFSTSALVLAEKGYARRVAWPVLLRIVGKTHPTFSNTFLQEFCKADLRWMEATCKPASYQARHFCLWYSIAVRAHQIVGRRKDAIETIKRAHERGIAIRPAEYVGIAKALTSKSDLSMRVVLEKLYEEQVKAFPNSFNEAPRDLDTLIHTHQSFPSNPVACYDFSEEINNAKGAAKYGLILLSRRPPSVLTGFLKTLLQLGDRETLEFLHNKAYTSDLKYRSVWCLAEMRHYFHSRRLALVYIVYALHFPLVGVPREVHDFIKSEYPSGDVKGPPVSKYEFLVTSEYPLRSKLFPLRVHNSIVWRACAAGARDVAHLESLYSEFLDISAFARNLPSEVHQYSGYVDEKMYTEYNAAPVDFDAEHFDVFIEEFGRRCGPSRAAKVILDMSRHHIEPDDRCLNHLCWTCAIHGEIENLIKILDISESEQVDDRRLPTASLNTYVQILRTLREMESFEGAAKIIDRLTSKRGYTYGQHQALDAILGDLSGDVPGLEAWDRWVRKCLNYGDAWLSTSIILSFRTIRTPPLMSQRWSTSQVPKLHSHDEDTFVSLRGYTVL